MKITLEYNGPDEEYDALAALYGRRYRAALQELDETLRKATKYGEEGWDPKTTDAVREVFFSILSENLIDINEEKL